MTWQLYLIVTSYLKKFPSSLSFSHNVSASMDQSSKPCHVSVTTSTKAEVCSSQNSRNTEHHGKQEGTFRLEESLLGLRSNPRLREQSNATSHQSKEFNAFKVEQICTGLHCKDFIYALIPHERNMEQLRGEDKSQWHFNRENLNAPPREFAPHVSNLHKNKTSFVKGRNQKKRLSGCNSKDETFNITPN